MEATKEIKEHMVDEVLVFCVNDGAVMDAWAKDQGVDQENGLMKFFGDPTSALTDALNIRLEHPGPKFKGLIRRSKRTASYVEDGIIKAFAIAEKPDDPAGDDFPEVTLWPAMKMKIEEVSGFMKSEF